MPIAERFYISPPFGNYMHFKGATSIAGSFTWMPRPGRTGQILRTVRPIPGGWVNAIGLRNGGIQNQDEVMAYWPGVFSLAAIGASDWYCMAEYLRRLSADMQRKFKIELNLSCPNVEERGITTREIRAFVDHTSQFEVMAKLPPTNNAMKLAGLCVDSGILHLHIGNAFPSPAGGISGAPLLKITPPWVEAVAAMVGSPCEITGGGGIKRPEHVQTYRDAGATSFSISTGCLHPFRIRNLIRSESVSQDDRCSDFDPGSITGGL